MAATQGGFHDDWFNPERLRVVLVDDDLAGVVDAYPSNDTTLYVSRIEVMPEFQGRGLGTRLMRQLIEDARVADLSAGELDVLAANGGARRLYERLAFQIIAESAPKQRMRLDLTAGPHDAGHSGELDAATP